MSTRSTPAREIAAFVIVVSLQGFPQSGAQRTTQSQAPEETIQQLIVRIDADLEFGAGIIVGANADILYIATANHVVRRGTREAQRVVVQFRGGAGHPTPAKLLPNRDEALDLAVLSVSGLKDIPIDPGSLPFDRLGDPQALNRGDPVFLIGHPNGLAWRMNTVPERFTERREQSLNFESNLLAKGHSGGALLNEDSDVIGMLKSDQPPYGEAIDIYAIARTLAAWGYPVKLQLPPARVSAGDARTCVLLPGGATRCWGYDSRYERGPLEIEGVRLKVLSTGGDHVCGIGPGGDAVCVGNNNVGQLGDGTTTSRYDAPAAVKGGLTFSSIGAGVGHTCGVTRSGDAYCWGQGSEGQLGSAFSEGSTTPVRVPSNERFKAVSARWTYSCALSLSGRAYCWGAVAAVEGMRWKPTAVFAQDVTFVSLTTGYHHVCGIATTGAAFCWGFNDDGQLGNGSTSRQFAEKETRVSGGLTFTSLSAGVSHTCGVATGGKAYCWGLNNKGQLGNGTKTSSDVPRPVSGDVSFESISAGNLHTCGVTTDGSIYCWGDNARGGPGGDESEGAVGPSGKSEHTVPWRVLQVPPDERFPWRERSR
jgi:alpha-tubulin suppressor-like RCC1 family protein